MKLDRFIKRPVLSTVISILIVILGVLGLVSLPVTQYPDIAPPTVHVSTSYTGANAQTVLNSVIAPLEEQITLFSTVWALAPVYDVLTCTVGGAISGY